MKTKRQKPCYTQSRIAELTGMDRRTVASRLANVPPAVVLGKRQQWLLESVFMGITSDTESESRKQLADARRCKLNLEIECIRRSRIPLEIVEEINNEVFSNIRGIILASRTLSDSDKSDLLEELRGIAAKIEEASEP